METKRKTKSTVLQSFAPAVRQWFTGSFPQPTEAQAKGWSPIIAGKSTLLLAPTGSGKILAAFLASLNRLMFAKEPEKNERCRVLYISPLKWMKANLGGGMRTTRQGKAMRSTYWCPRCQATMLPRSG